MGKAERSRAGRQTQSTEQVLLALSFALGSDHCLSVGSSENPHVLSPPMPVPL